MSHFLAMGGYAFYVWTSYGIAFLIMAIGIIKPLLTHRNQLRELQLKRLRGQR
ncbi:MAG: heme exporter protein CcmD [Methylococcales bacterium]